MKIFLVAIFLIMATEVVRAECGTASWYVSNGTTASGEKMNNKRRTAAHRRLPFGSRLSVYNQKTKKRVEVIVNDRGPWSHGRILDLSKAAAVQLGMISTGTAKVCFSIL